MNIETYEHDAGEVAGFGKKRFVYLRIFRLTLGVNVVCILMYKSYAIVIAGVTCYE